MINTYVTDTQALVKYFEGKKVISKEIHRIFELTEFGEAKILVPSVVLFEIGYLFEKGRISISLEMIKNAFSLTDYMVEQVLDFATIQTAFEIQDVKELHDKLIAGTARHLNLPLLTNDPIIRASQFVTCI